jgi:hypothetical protein
MPAQWSSQCARRHSQRTDAARGPTFNGARLLASAEARGLCRQKKNHAGTKTNGKRDDPSNKTNLAFASLVLAR